MDYDVFYLPGVDAQYGKPFLVAGDIMAATTERPETCAVMQFFSTGEGVKGWLAAGGALGPQNDVQLDWYGVPLERTIAGLAAAADTVRFDASDLMPGAVGSGSFWKGMTDYFSGAADLDTVLKQIDASWPESAKAPAAAAATASVGASAEGAASKNLTCLADAYTGKMKGTKVTMAGPFTDEDAVKFDNSMKAFEDATGIDIQYQGSKEFEASITTQMQAGTASDIVDFPQPGLLGTFFKQGKVVPVDQARARDLAEGELQPVVAGHGDHDRRRRQPDDGRPVAALQRQEPGVVSQEGLRRGRLQVPTTWEELMALQDQIVADGDTPWCVGIESGAATGWPATDWTEDLMLRTTSPENYDKWVKGELKFDSPEVKKAIQTFADIWNNDKMVYGGKAKIVTHVLRRCAGADVREPAQVLAAPPGQLHHLLLPARKPRRAWTMTSSTCRVWIRSTASRSWWPATSWRPRPSEPETCAVMQFFSTGEGVKGWLAAGGALGSAEGRAARLVRRAVGAHDRWAGRGGRHRALRRLGSDARRGRLWFLLEGHDRLLLRRGRSGHRPEANRRFLAEVVASGWRVER